MTIHCNIFHATDGACCDSNTPCISAVQRSPILRPQTPLLTEMLWLIVGLGAAVLVLMGAFVQMERQQRTDDIVNQEMRPSVIVATETGK